jgi:hypothetical protein
MITGMTKHFMLYIRWISVRRFLYFNFFSASFCINIIVIIIIINNTITGPSTCWVSTIKLRI